MEYNNKELTLPRAELKDLPTIIDFVDDWLKKNDFERIAPAILTAIDEACTNIIKYAYSDNSGFLSLSCQKEGDIAIISIKDTGKPFHPDSASLPDLESNIEDRTIGGLGIYLINKLMDEVSYTSEGRQGNILTMKKKAAR